MNDNMNDKLKALITLIQECLGHSNKMGETEKAVQASLADMIKICDNLERTQ